MWCSITPSMSYATINITITLLCVGRTFGRGEPGCFHSFDCHFKCGLYERAPVLSRMTILPRKSSPSLWYRFNKSCAIAIVAPRTVYGVPNVLQFCGSQECRAECGARFCGIRLPQQLTPVQSINVRHPARSKELNCVVVNMGSS